jgi:hypothetical protein
MRGNVDEVLPDIEVGNCGSGGRERGSIGDDFASVKEPLVRAKTRRY